MEKNKIEALKSALNKNKGKALILSHKNPDGDAVGSSLGWQAYMESKGWDCQIYLPNQFPDFLAWIPNADKIKLTEEEGQDSLKQSMQEADLIFCLDFNAHARIDGGKFLKEFHEKIVLIDHHLNPEDLGFIQFSDPKSCATAELVVRIIEGLESNLSISKEGATSLFVGILTDTGSFRFPSTTSYTFTTAAKLVEQGADNADIYAKIYDTNSLSRLQLLGHTLSKAMKVYEEKGAALISLSSKDLLRHGFKKGDAEGFVNYPLSVGSIKLAAMFKEDKDIVKVSLRSKGDVAVNLLSEKYFSGGGHKNAAGGKFDGSLEDAILQFEKMLDEV